MRPLRRCPTIAAALVFVLSVVAAGFAEPAEAVPPALVDLAQQKRHPTGRIVAPRAESVIVSIASKPDRATDGEFFTENVEDIDPLTDQELQTGAWLSETALDPGTWYLLANASAETSCYSAPPPTYQLVRDPACAHGYSEVVTLVVPKPASRYAATVRPLTSIGIVHLTLRAAPLGEARPYRVCWRLANRRRVCVRGRLDGYDWDAATTHRVRVNTRGMAARTTFTWYVGSRTVATRSARTRR